MKTNMTWKEAYKRLAAIIDLHHTTLKELLNVDIPSGRIQADPGLVIQLEGALKAVEGIKNDFLSDLNEEELYR